MEVRISDTNPAVVTISQNGVNDPAAVTVTVEGRPDGRLYVHAFGGDPDRQGENADYPTLVEAIYHPSERTAVEILHVYDEPVAGPAERDLLEQLLDKVQAYPVEDPLPGDLLIEAYQLLRRLRDSYPDLLDEFADRINALGLPLPNRRKVS